MKPGGKRAALHLRISKKPTGSRSSEESDGDVSYSVDDQRVRCEALCAAAGYEVAAVFYDDGVSAYRSLKDRPGYGELRDAIDAKAFDVLVFDRQDRLARDQRETMRFIIRCGDAGIEWHSAQEGAIDLNDTMAVMFAIFRGGEAQAYSDKISKNQKNANTRKREKGLPGAGGRPFGYEADKVTIRDAEADLIRRGTKMILSGSARYEVLRVFRESGLTSVRGSDWHVANVTALLKRWRNAGWVEHGDEPYIEAVWPAIVELDDVRKVRAILGSGREPGRWKKPTQLCSGIAKCRCGFALMVTGDDDGPAYRCSEIISRGRYSPGHHVTIGARILDPVVREAVVDSYFTRPASSTAGKAEAAGLAKLYERKEAARAERGKVQSGYKAGIYTETEAAREVAKIEAVIADIDAEISATAAQSAHAAMLTASMASLFVNAADADVYGPDEDGTQTFNVTGALLKSAARQSGDREAAINQLVRTHWADDAEGAAAILAETGQSTDGLDLDHFFATNPDKARVREELGRRFDALDLEQRRNLVRSLVRVTVRPGRGIKRVEIASAT